MCEYHVFLSYASEDGKTFARPLYERLIDENYRVWYDEQEIEWGDELKTKITEGLKKSQYGMVVISPKYFAKHKEWTFMEFNHILESGKILPILYNIKLPEIQRDHPKEYESIKNWKSISIDQAEAEGIKYIEYIVQQTQRKLGVPIKKFDFQTAEISTNLLSTVTKTKSAEYFTQNLRNGVTLEMVSIPGGTFKMGSPENEEGYRSSQSPQHKVTVPPFFMGKYSVTQQQWRVVAALEKVNIDLKSDPSHFKGDGSTSLTNNLPVERVSWNDAQEFCARLSRMANKTYRLPTEAEWEYACRGGTTTPFYCGETISTDLANYDGNYTYGQGQKGEYREKTTKVGIFPANPFGLYDMCGNVWEWCEDGWHENYINAPIDGSAWTSLGSKVVLRGGSWVNDPQVCRSASRGGNYGGERGGIYNVIGFRVVCVVGRIIR
ncbi:SUMF1/EgtB/PvdO family nonheme iron enzyme [Dolichospermum planctonicum]|uniref:SUMF1/EgtB/PvdO family nonheme iron enzyme n=1 Tax=Dolichospermum planctonicum TaxID=136072 RepID=UPI002FEE316E